MKLIGGRRTLRPPPPPLLFILKSGGLSTNRDSEGCDRALKGLSFETRLFSLVALLEILQD